MELARRQIDRKVNKVIRKPYFCHVDYKYNAELYLGKQQVAGWITDWADEQASLYYQWQMYIGNEDKKLELVRDVHISDGDYQGYTDLYNAHQKETKSTTVADQHLAQIIAANQKNKKSMILLNLYNKTSIELLRLIWILHFWCWDVLDQARP